MNSKVVSIAQVFSYDSRYYYYKKTTTYTVYYGYSQYVYLVDVLFRPISAKLKIQEGLDNTYQQFRKLNIPALNEFRILQKMKVPYRNLLEISLRDIEEVRAIISRSVVVNDQENSTLLSFKQDDQLQSLLLLGVDLTAPVLKMQRLSCVGISYLKSQLELFQRIEQTAFDAENEEHEKMLRLLLGNLKQFTMALPTDGNILVYLEPFFSSVTESPLYRRIGFQSNKPASDFRSSGLFGLLSLIYFSGFDCDFLLNRSYVLEVSSQEDLLNYLQNTQKCEYRYPLAISIINISKFITEELFVSDLNHSNLVNCLLNQYSKEFSQIEEKYDIYREMIEQLLEQRQFVMISHPEAEENPTKVRATAEDFQLPQLSHLPTAPMTSENLQLSAIHPGLFGSILLLICKLVALLDHRLRAYQGDEIYIRFNEEMRIVEADFKRVVRMDDIGDLEDLIFRMDE